MTKEELKKLEIDGYRYTFEGILDGIRLTKDERDQIEGSFYDLLNSFEAYLKQ